MTLLDRFRTLSRDKHPDPAVRLAFVDELPLDDPTTIAAIAREDGEPRVRKAAVSKLMVPSVLAAIAREDSDEGVRAQAITMLRDIALEAFEETGEGDSLEAVAAIADSRILLHVAKSSSRASVAVAALTRVDDAHMLGSTARHAVTEAARTTALERLVARGDRTELFAVAMNGDFKDSALAALDTIADRETLDHVIARGRNKSAVKRARFIVREAEAQAAREAAGRAAEAALTIEAIAAHPAVPDPEPATATPPHGDPLAAQIDSDARTSVDTVTQPAESTPTREQSGSHPLADAQELVASDDESAKGQARLAALIQEAEASVGDENLLAARKHFSSLRREWRSLTHGVQVDESLQARFTDLDVQMTTREAAAREADARARREHLARVTSLLARIESSVIPSQTLTSKIAERALHDVRGVLAAMPSLPSKQDFEDVTRRLKAAQAALIPRVQELREADDWRRFANAGLQEQLCARMEALRTVEDPEALAKEVRELQQQWRAAADVPRSQAEALWRRFKTAHDEVWARCEAYFAAQAHERDANLARKTALCEQAESLADSTKWLQTAEQIKKLQAEWKTIGPVSRGKERAIWERFRTACDRFFTRRHADMAERKAMWAANLEKKDALCARAEELARSSDWEAAGAEIKKLQAEWKTVGPVKKTRSEAIWQRFRGACDAFFARYSQRHDVAREERIAAREAVCTELERLSGADEAPADVPATLRGLRGRWQQEVTARGVDPDRARALEQRFSTAFAAVISRWPASFAGTDLDPHANQKRMEALVRRVEALASAFAPPAPSDDELSPTRLASMLKEALAANTIGGKVEDEHRFRAAADDLRDAQAAWSRIGLVPDAARRDLTERFQRAARSVAEKVGRTSEVKSGR